MCSCNMQNIRVAHWEAAPQWQDGFGFRVWLCGSVSSLAFHTSRNEWLGERLCRTLFDLEVISLAELWFQSSFIIFLFLTLTRAKNMVKYSMLKCVCVYMFCRIQDLDLQTAIDHLRNEDHGVQVIGAAYIQHVCYHDKDAKEEVFCIDDTCG